MDHTYKSALQLEKAVHLEKCDTLPKLDALAKWVTLGKMHHTWKNDPILERRGTLGKISTLKNMGNTLKNGLHVEKWATYEFSTSK